MTASPCRDIFWTRMFSRRADLRCRMRGKHSSPRSRALCRTRRDPQIKRPVVSDRPFHPNCAIRLPAASAPEAAAPVANADRAADRTDERERGIAAPAARAATAPVADAAASHRFGLRIVELAQRIRNRRAARGAGRRVIASPLSDTPAIINSAIKNLLISLSPVNRTTSVRVPARFADKKSRMIAKKSRLTHSSLVH